jgi:signal transduction histidine kinase
LRYDCLRYDASGLTQAEFGLPIGCVMPATTAPELPPKPPRRMDYTGPKSAPQFFVFSPSTRLRTVLVFAAWSVLGGVASAFAGEPLRSALQALTFLPLSVAGVGLARKAAERTTRPVSDIWANFATGLSLGVIATAIYGAAFFSGKERFGVTALPFVLAAVALFARVYLLTVRAFRGSKQNVLEAMDFVTVAFVFVSVLGYGVGIPLVLTGRVGRLHIPLLAAFAIVFVFAILFVLLTPLERNRAPELVFLTAGILLVAGTLWESSVLVTGSLASSPSPSFSGPQGTLLLLGLASVALAPVFAVELPPGSEAAFRGPWQLPRLLLPYWSLLGLVLVTAVAIYERSSAGLFYVMSCIGVVVFLLIAREILTLRENYELFRSLVEASIQRKALLAELLKGLEEERARLAGAIEAGPIEELSTLKLRAERAASRETTNPQLLLDALTEHLSRVLQAMREMVRTLRPRLSSAKNLTEAVELQARETLGAAGIALQLDTEIVEGLTPLQELHLYRIAEEAIDNIRLHAGATKARIVLRTFDSVAEGLRLGAGRHDRFRKSRSGQQTSASSATDSLPHKILLLEISDNGKGFLQQPMSGPRSIAGAGIPAMRERAELLGASFELISTPGAGTIVRLLLPLRHQESESTNNLTIADIPELDGPVGG